MTFREMIVCASPLESGVTVREHLQAMNCLLLGGDLYVNTEGIELQEENSIILIEESDTIEITEVIEQEISVSDDVELIIQEGDEIDGLC